ncbi:hypothetical protein DFH09DRAFT_1327758 [Mycena vulgaris]|nr:hypothetical protein DFH09DRAFT_1327758 [Mycena vulgaris]
MSGNVHNFDKFLACVNKLQREIFLMSAPPSFALRYPSPAQAEAPQGQSCRSSTASAAIRPPTLACTRWTCASTSARFLPPRARAPPRLPADARLRLPPSVGMHATANPSWPCESKRSRCPPYDVAPLLLPPPASHVMTLFAPGSPAYNLRRRGSMHAGWTRGIGTRAGTRAMASEGPARPRPPRAHDVALVHNPHGPVPSCLHQLIPLYDSALYNSVFAHGLAAAGLAPVWDWLELWRPYASSGEDEPGKEGAAHAHTDNSEWTRNSSSFAAYACSMYGGAALRAALPTPPVSSPPRLPTEARPCATWLRATTPRPPPQQPSRRSQIAARVSVPLAPRIPPTRASLPVPVSCHILSHVYIVPRGAYRCCHHWHRTADVVGTLVHHHLLPRQHRQPGRVSSPERSRSVSPRGSSSPSLPSKTFAACRRTSGVLAAARARPHPRAVHVLNVPMRAIARSSSCRTTGICISAQASPTPLLLALNLPPTSR